MGPSVLAFLAFCVTAFMKTRWKTRDFILMILESFHLLADCLPTGGKYVARLSV